MLLNTPRSLLIISGIMCTMAIAWVAGIDIPTERGLDAIAYFSWLFCGAVFGFLFSL